MCRNQRHGKRRNGRKAVTPKSFRNDVISWITVSGMLFAINAFFYPGHWWAIYPFFFWGIGIVFQAAELAKNRHLEEYDEPEPIDPIEKEPKWKEKDLV